ncbi:MAG TPA: hypothetical protein VGR07_04450, partial [Thermoanaerobaculia bacterium]|nr:hypothetical protein [Thermoanaerobaculia bacterium]
CCLPLKVKARPDAMLAVIMVTGIFLLGLARPAAADLWTPLGPDGGTATVVAVDPGNSNTVYAGTPGSGVWWSANGGRLWRRTALGGRSVLWLGVAHGSGRVYALAGTQLYRSPGRGGAWTALAPGLLAILSVALPPGSPDTVYVVGWTESGGYRIVKSTDGGDSWTTSWDSPAGTIVIQFVADPNDPQTLFVATTSGVYRTIDGGLTWGVGDLPGKIGGLAVEQGPRRRLLAWEATLGSPFPGDTAFFVSSDHGLTWRPRPVYGGVVTRLVTDPTAPGAFYAVDTFGNLLRTGDVGLHWTAAGLVPHNGPVYDLAPDPLRPGVAFLAVEGSRFGRTLWKTSNYGAAWTLFQRELQAGYFLFVTPDPANPATLWAGAGILSRPLPGSGGLPGYVPGLAPYGVWRNTDRATTWTGAGLQTISIQALVFGAAHRRFAATLGHGLQQSDDGETWRRIPGPRDLVLALASPAAEPSTLYALSDSTLSKDGFGRSLDISLDHGTTFTSHPLYANVLATGPGAPGVPGAPAALYANLTPSDVFGSTLRDGVQRTTDRGATWTKLFDVPGVAVRAIAADPAPGTAPRRIVAGFERGENGELHGGIEISLDNGATWAEASLAPERPGVLSLLADPLVPHGFLAGTRNGVYASPDGITWTPLGEGLPRVAVVHLSAGPGSSHSLYAATAGLGLYDLERTTP